MNINDYSFHDATIIEVKEHPNQVLDFHISFAKDWNNNIYEPRILRFINVVHYTSHTIPFTGTQAILEINGLPSNTTASKVVEIITNVGRRTIEYSDCDLIILD